MTHSSFDLSKPLLARFEQEAGVKLQLIQGGDAGEMLNKLILSQAAPVADVVYGIDNTLLPRALASGILAPFPSVAGSAAQRPAHSRQAALSQLLRQQGQQPAAQTHGQCTQ